MTGEAETRLAARADSSVPVPAENPPRPRLNLFIPLVPALLVLITFLFWYQTWFGKRLNDRELGEYLSDTSVPHKTQHALSQLAAEIARGDRSVQRWYPQVIGLAGNKEAELRLMAAWVMGQDNKSEIFHKALQGLLQDPEPMVRWNAALALVRFGDSGGRSQLLLMLRPFALLAPEAGTITFRLKEQDAVRRGSVIARIRDGDAKTVEVRSPLGGQVEHRLANDGAKVALGERIALLSPGEVQVWESLRALYLVGKASDLDEVEKFARGASGISERVRQQAALTAQAIRQRPVTGH